MFRFRIFYLFSPIDYKYLMIMICINNSELFFNLKHLYIYYKLVLLQTSYTYSFCPVNTSIPVVLLGII